MRIIKEVQTTTIETVDILCNKCGKSLKQEYNYCGLIEESLCGNYESPYLNDLDYYSFALCEACLLDLFQSFKIPVLIAEYNPLHYTGDYEDNEPFELIPVVKDNEIIDDQIPVELTEEDIYELY